MVTPSAGFVVSEAAESTILDLLATQATRGSGFHPDEIVQIDNELIFWGDPTGIKSSVLLPDGWTFHRVSGPEFADSPSAGEFGLLEFSWSSTPAPRFAFSYYLNVPA